MNWVHVLLIIFVILILLFILVAIILSIWYPKEVIIGIRDIDPDSIGIVVSRYKENLDWLQWKEIEELKKKYKVNIYIYNKGDDEIHIEGCKIINLPNVGVNDHTYLYHIIYNYNNLDDVTIFLTGSSTHKDRENISKSVLKNAAKYGCYFTYVTKSKKLKRFTLSKYETRCKINRSDNSTLIQCPIQPYGEWYKHVMGKELESNDVNYMGVFSLGKDDIHKYSRDHYQELIKYCEVGKLCEASHYMERLWYNMYK